MNRDLLFFCTFCREKTEDEISSLNCTIEHTVKTYKKGEYIAYQGDTLVYLYILSKGKVKTEMLSDSGIAITIERISAPYPLAAAFLFADNNHFPVDVVALEDCEILRIGKDAVEKQIAKCPGFLRGFMAFNANRMHFLSDRLKIFSQKGIKAKLAYYILQHDKHGHFALGQSISSLSDYFGVERPSLSRALSEMSREGIIEYHSGSGRILDYNAIKELLK
jgi:CRP-like cAMP-binding protein